MQAPHLPIDYCILFTGQSVLFSEILAKQRNIFESELVKKFLLDTLQRQELAHLSERSEVFRINPIENFQQDIAFLNACLLKEFYDLLYHAFDDEYSARFVSTINEFGIVSMLYEREHELFFNIQNAFRHVRDFHTESIGVCPLNISRAGGAFFCVTQYAKSRETVERLVAYLRDTGYRHARIEYASWRDGTAGEGIRLQQHVRRDIFSEFLSRDLVQLFDTTGRRVVDKYDMLPIHREERTLVFDMVRNEVRIDSRILGSKELPSKSGAIAIFSVLIERAGSDIESRQLGASSYTKNRNEMLSKIITPIQKAVEQSLGERINVETR